MFINLMVGLASAAIGLAGVLFASKGASRTQATLHRGMGNDKVIDAMAWIDRAIFHGKPKAAARIQEHG